ncbi:hypothetical protein COO91_07694 [Nostoc flagelliforme CCNUN1]|uniref:Uncharacterized protein n=1 Tax=Nostoc flagelliforme CCNUN1 TaxID=2038116 RepID=A0A2K8T1S0_9NOSO|nr:hypothetical protein COO91_07694 [Nostoc flagelliforme CCNUN1]
MWFQNRLVCGLKRLCLQFATTSCSHISSINKRMKMERHCTHAADSTFCESLCWL